MKSELLCDLDSYIISCTVSWFNECIPANLFLRYRPDIFILGVIGFLKTTRSFPKKFEVFRRSRKSSEDVWSPSPSLRTRINASSLPVLFTSKIGDCEEVIVIYSCYTWFLFLTWVWVNKFLEFVPSKTATTHIFQSGMRNWPTGMSRHEIKVFDPQAWELAGIWMTNFLLYKEKAPQKICVSCFTGLKAVVNQGRTFGNSALFPAIRCNFITLLVLFKQKSFTELKFSHTNSVFS